MEKKKKSSYSIFTDIILSVQFTNHKGQTSKATPSTEEKH